MDILWDLGKKGRPHANLSNLVWVCKDELTLALEPLLPKSCSLRQWMDNSEDFHQLTNSQRLGIAEKIADALHFLHANGFCHNDVRPTNIVLGADPKNDVLLVDFGRACRFSNQQPRPITDTPSIYAPPEALRRQSLAVAGEVRDACRDCVGTQLKLLSS